MSGRVRDSVWTEWDGCICGTIWTDCEWTWSLGQGRASTTTPIVESSSAASAAAGRAAAELESEF
jgi:hypothetical protein